MHGLIDIDATEWKTPLTGIEDRTVGNARLKHTTYGRGYYRLEGTHGQEFYRVTKGRLPVMTLERRDGRSWKIWMVDDPLHWWGMRERVERLPAGTVLCAGLGLGLMVHHLVTRKDILDITVVEIDPDVIELVTPTLPKDSRITVLEDDYYSHIKDISTMSFGPDSVLWDLAVGTYSQTSTDFLKGEILTKHFLPKAHLSMFGKRFVDRPADF